LGERQALMHPEAMLFVDCGQREIAKLDLLLEQGMGADQHVDLAQGQPSKDVIALASALATSEDGDVYVGRSGDRRKGIEMLSRQNFSRSHQGCLPASFNDC